MAGLARDHHHACGFFAREEQPKGGKRRTATKEDFSEAMQASASGNLSHEALEGKITSP